MLLVARRAGLLAGAALGALLMPAGCGRAASSEQAAPAGRGGAPAVAARAGASGPATRPAGDLAADQAGCLAADCHQSLLRVSYRHGPVQAGACEACHQPEQPGHKFPLRRAGLAGCTFCHPVIGQQRYLHQAISERGCLSCHDPHGSETKFLLRGASVELTCQGCHQIARRPFLHGPFAGGQCTACHRPHESANRFLLLGGAGRQHCLLCHQSKRHQLQAARVIHAPLEAGCTGCHEPHSADYAHLLNAPLAELCFTCHTDVEGKVAEAKSPHGAVFRGERCANCHDPHAEGRPHLLRDELLTLCLRCHSQPQRAYDGRTIPDMRPVLLNRKYLHGPVRRGQCNACHEVHGASYARLLRDYFPPQFYQAFHLANYALCFECHSQGLVLQPRTTRLTRFRDGERNLHYVHVNRPEKGRTCRTCHEIHGSNLPGQMASAVPFEGGQWPLPIHFVPSAAGGRCSPGCHEPREYRRGAPRPVPAPTSRPGAGGR